MAVYLHASPLGQCILKWHIPLKQIASSMHWRDSSMEEVNQKRSDLTMVPTLLVFSKSYGVPFMS